MFPNLSTRTRVEGFSKLMNVCVLTWKRSHFLLIFFEFGKTSLLEPVVNSSCLASKRESKAVVPFSVSASLLPSWELPNKFSSIFYWSQMRLFCWKRETFLLKLAIWQYNISFQLLYDFIAFKYCFCWLGKI